MNCRKAEKLLLKSWDGVLDIHESEILEQHLKSCPACSHMQKEYEAIFAALKTIDYPTLKPYFWERLQPKLHDRKIFNPWAQWKFWGLRAIPVALIIVVLMAGALSVIGLREPDKLSSSEALLLQNQNPLQDASSILDEVRVEDKNMRLIFASLEEPQPTRDKLP
jgi:predicted anti-sigma-YlaC factor YlaD